MRSPDRRIVPAVRRWYRQHGRSLPWRGESDPYRIILSEIMLQQTQVSRVLGHYGRFLHRFPSMRSLAGSSRREVILAWRGMGYNNRAVRLHALASVLVERGMRVPRSAQALLELPGIGRYTAHAILSSVHGLPVPVVDVNIRRLLSRVLWRMRSTHEMRSEADIWQAAERLLPRRGVYDWNQALMDIGATICTSRRPSCDGCPLERFCASQRTMTERAAKPRKNEPRFHGVPNRIYRGRMVEALREQRAGFTAEALGRAVYAGFSKNDETWLAALLSGLERDGLIRIRRRRTLLGSGVTLS